MDNKQTTTEYYFTIREYDSIKMDNFPLEKTLESHVTFNSSCRWQAPLYEFVKLLGCHYGYDIVNKIQIDGQSLDNAVFNEKQRESIIDALNAFNEKERKEFANEPSMKKKDKKKKIKNFFMGSADDWAEEE